MFFRPQPSGVVASTMPAGVPLERYAKFTAAALLTMLAGAQLVHLTYRPLDELPELIEQTKKQKLADGSNAQKNDVGAK